ncbi:hypothetical protein F4860DRAFT_526840 [Xylaria cubensis]|nr:hypothetical protein F4860DRAFT_526840 [Xylaria cubensis]
MASQSSADPPGQHIESSPTQPKDVKSLQQIYPPPPPLKHNISVDIVAIYSHSKDTNPPWIFRLPPPSRKLSPRPPTAAERIREIQTFDNVRSFIKDISNVPKQAPTQPQPGAGAAQSSQQATRDGRQQQEQGNNIELPAMPPVGNEPVRNDGPSSRSRSGTKDVNWIKELLPGSFPNAKVMLCSFESSDKPTVASTLIKELERERKDITPGISRPIIFIANGDGSIVVGEALKDADLAAATIGLVIFCPPSGDALNISNVLNIAKHNILTTYFYDNRADEINETDSADRFIRKIKLNCPEAELGRFKSSEDSNYLKVRDTIRIYINFIATRRLWNEISRPRGPRGLEEVKTQILKGASINGKNSQGQSALHLAVEVKSLDTVKLLLESDANVNAKNKHGRSPIEEAIKGNNVGIVLALLERGATLDKAKVKADPQVDEEIKTLLETVTYFAGPSTQHDNGKYFGESYRDSVPDDCRDASSQFDAIVTTFELRSDKNSGNSARSSAGEIEREYHTSRTVPVSELLYGEEDNSLINDGLGPKKWRWYHLPVNNMDWVKALLFRLQVGNEDGRLSGTEHRGPHPHTLFLQPRANVLDRGDYKITVVFTPYLHFETNEGRVRLRHAIKQITSNLADDNDIYDNDEDDDSSDEDDESSDESDDSSGKSDDSSIKSDYVSDEGESNSDSEEDQSTINSRRKESEFKKKFEKFRDQIRHYQEKLGEGKSKCDRLINAYFARETHHLHIRRTLDQFYYEEDTDVRDTSQVVQRYAVKGLPKISKKETMSSKLIMVDQLWLWMLQNQEKAKNIVITSFPQAWCQNEGSKTDAIDLHEQIHKYLHRQSREAITSVNQLASVIIKECTRVFGPFKRPSEPEFLDNFNSSISDVNDRLSTIYNRLPDTLWNVQKNNLVEKETQKHKKTKRKKDTKNSRHKIAREVELLVEIQDIQDELDIIKMVLDQQSSVLTVPQDGADDCTKSKETLSYDTFPTVDGKPVDHYTTANKKTIEGMRVRAADVYRRVNHLIDLKQKQANLEEAQYAREEATSAAKEGKTILALTIVNMLFLPLSFLSSFFALDITEFPKDLESGENSLSLAWASKYIFGISLAIAIPSIALALAIGPLEGPAKRLWHPLKRVLALFAVIIVGLILVVPLSIAMAAYAYASYRRQKRRRYLGAPGYYY